MMADCKMFQSMMADALAGELSAAERNQFDKHLQTCKQCAAEYAELEAVIHQVKQRPRPKPDEAFWVSYMNRLDEKIDVFEQKQAAPLMSGSLKGDIISTRWRRALMPVAAAALVVFGVWLGRLSLRTPTESGEKTGQTASLAQAFPVAKTDPQLLLAHLSDMEPLLIEWKNRSGQSGEQTVVGAQHIRDLLLQNYMLKRLLARQNDKTRKALLDDLEMILLEMAAKEDDDSQPIDGVQKMIEENGVLFKVRVLRKQGDTI